MQLRRFTADTTPAALGAVRMALGDEAIILSNRRQGNLIEIIATGQMDDAATLSDMSVDDIQEELRSTAEALATSIEASQQETLKPTVPSSEPAVKSTDSTQTVEEKLQSLSQEPLANALSKSAVEQIVRDEQEALRQEVLAGAGTKEDLDAMVASSTNLMIAAFDNQARKMEEHFRSLTVNMWGSNASSESEHLKKLLSLGIGAELSVDLVEQTADGVPLDKALRTSYAKLKTLLPVSIDTTSAVSGVTVVSGAPGSGKTTTLVKLAAEHVKNQGNQSIVFICTNTRRIGAFEELEAYGRLLGVPTVHAHDTSELGSLVEAFKHKQLVLIDHTLLNDHDSVQLPDCLLNPDDKDSVRQLFVLPATTQALTVDHLISNHCSADNICCVLTHLDSNARLGEILSAVIRHQLPIAYWSDSSSVQRPLQKAEASVLVATAVAMAGRIPASADDILMQKLIQPSNATFSRNNPNVDSKNVEEL